MTSVNPLQQVFDEAKREFESKLPSCVPFRSLLSATTIDEVYDAAEKYQKEQEQGKLSKLRHLQRIQPLLARLKEYAGVIEVFVQAQPEILALIWGPIKLLLQWTSGWSQGFDAVIKTMERIGELLPCFNDFVIHFLDIERIKDLLGLFYRDILDFYLALVQLFSMSRRKMLFETIWPKQREMIKRVEERLQKHSRLLGENVTYEHIKREHEAREKAFEHFRDEKTSRASQRFLALEAAINPPKYGARFDGLSNKICGGTARWLEKDTAFQSWIDMSNPLTKLLWLRGIPGAGKTFLAGWVTSAAKKAGRTIYAFPSHRDKDAKGPSTQTLHADTAAISIMHSLLFQLATRDVNIQAMLTDSDRSDLQTNTKVAKELLADVLKYAGDTFVVIDGLDEVDEFQRVQFLTSLMEILDASADPKLKICISSRAEDDMARILEPRAVTICIDKKNTGAIFTYVNSRYKEWMAKSDFLDEGASEIKSLLQPVCVKAKGMFLYARIVLDNVVNLINLEEIRSELRALPDGLDDAYERVLARIRKSPCRDGENAKRILGWIGCSPIPMTEYELEQAMLVAAAALTDAPTVDGQLNLVKLCGPIVEVVDDELQYVHFTVKEYIFNKQPSFVSIRDSTMELLVVCLTYLCYDAVNDDSLKDDQIIDNLLEGRYRLLVFASTMWFELVKRARRLTRDPSDLDVLSGLLNNLFAELENPRAMQDLADAGDDGDSSNTPPPPAGDPLWRGAPRFATQTFHFFANRRKDLWTSENADTWANLDPLTVSNSCARIETVYNGLLRHSTNNKHQQDCVCSRLRWHYGSNLFKCHYFACGLRRHGFEGEDSCDDHMTNHCRPWKCPVKSCDFAVIGYQTSPQLEKHRQRIHRVVPAAGSIEPSALEDEALYPLLYEAVDTGNIGELEALWLSYRHKVNDRSAAELVLMAAAQGSLSIVQMLLEWDDEMEKPVNDKVKLHAVVSDALQSGNLELARWILDKATAWSRNHFQARRYRDMVVAVLKSDSGEVFSVWHDVIISDRYNTGGCFPADELFEKTVLNMARRFPDQQMRLFVTWRRLVELGSVSKNHLGRALTYVAQTTCCTEQAKILLDLGAPIDFPLPTTSTGRKRQGHTALHWASKKTTQEAAEFMRFLVMEGADPFVFYGNSGPSDGEGARNIHARLNTTWDQLVEMGEPERKRRGKNY